MQSPVIFYDMNVSGNIPFVKYHGLGNDFIVLADPAFERDRRGGAGTVRLRSASKSLLGRLARSICERHTGVGADGLLVLTPPAKKGNDARMRVFNADGSEAEMSGNGIRCAAAYMASTGRNAHTLRFETAAGIKSILREPAQRQAKTAARRLGPGRTWVFQVGMGMPVLEPARIPFRAGDFPVPVVGFPLPTPKGIVNVTVTSMGNPHCSVFVDNYDVVDWLELGREIEGHELFPHRTNVEFVRVLSRNRIEVRYWERGVGQTQSSGTGSCAAVVASVLSGLTERRLRVHTLAGSLEVSWPEGGEVSLTGPAEWIAEGKYHFGNRR